MTQKLSELKVISSFEASGYVAGMAAKTAADRAGTASSERLGTTLTVQYDKISRAGNAAERLARTYIEGYAEAARFDVEVLKLGEAMERGNVSMDRAGAILDGIQKKFGRTAEAAKIAERGLIGLAKASAELNSRAPAAGPVTPSAGLVQPSLATVTALNQQAAAMDDLRAKYSPLYAVERAYHQQVAEITNAHRAGALSQTEMSLALARAEVAYTGQSRAIQQHSAVLQANRGNAALSSFAMTNLAFQINDVATMAAMGADPLRILASQAGQFYQILATGEGGVRGSLRYLGGVLSGLLTPFALATTAAVTFAGTGFLAAESWKSAQREINLALIGTGGAAGITAADINEIAFAAAETGKTTVGEARAMALAFAATGRIAGDLAGRLTTMSPLIAKVFGEDAPAAAERMARAFADPARGVDDLNKRLMAYDAATVQNIKSLAAQGRQFDAQRVLIKGVEDATKAAQAQTSGWASFWDRLTSAASRYWAQAGRSVAISTGGGTLNEQLEAAKSELERLQAGVRVRGNIFFDQAAIDEQIRKVEALSAAIRNVWDEAARAGDRQKSLGLSSAIQGLYPAYANLVRERDALANLESRFQDSRAVAGISQDDLLAYERAVALQKERVATAELLVTEHKSSAQIAQQDAEFSLRAVNARGAAEQAEVAYLQTRARLLREGDPNAEIKALAEKSRILEENRVRVSRDVEIRNYSSQASIDQARFELSLIGKTADEAARLRAEYEAVANVKSQAFGQFRTASPDELSEVRRLAGERSRLESQVKREQLTADLQFEREQISRSQTERDLYARMRGAGMLENGQITGALNEEVAATIRRNQELERSIELQKEFASSFVRDVMAGKSATEALSGALSNLASRLMESSLDKGLSALFGGLTGGTGSSLGSLFAGVFHSGGLVGANDNQGRAVSPAVFSGARRYHSGGVAGLAANEVPAILERGEIVLPKRASAREKASGGSDAGAGVTFHMPVSIDATGAYPESIVEIKRALNALPGQIMRSVADSRDRGII